MGLEGGAVRDKKTKKGNHGREEQIEAERKTAMERRVKEQRTNSSRVETETSGQGSGVRERKCFCSNKPHYRATLIISYFCGKCGQSRARRAKGHRLARTLRTADFIRELPSLITSVCLSFSLVGGHTHDQLAHSRMHQYKRWKGCVLNNQYFFGTDQSVSAASIKVSELFDTKDLTFDF